MWNAGLGYPADLRNTHCWISNERDNALSTSKIPRTLTFSYCLQKYGICHPLWILEIVYIREIYVSYLGEFLFKIGRTNI